MLHGDIQIFLLGNSGNDVETARKGILLEIGMPGGQTWMCQTWLALFLLCSPVKDRQMLSKEGDAEALQSLKYNFFFYKTCKQV